MRALDQGARAVLLLHNRVVPHFAAGVSRERKRLNARGLCVAIVFPAMALHDFSRGKKIALACPYSAGIARHALQDTRRLLRNLRLIWE